MRTCEDCERYLFNDDGSLVRRPAKFGLPVLRPKGSVTPCLACKKIPEGSPEPKFLGATATAEEMQAWRRRYAVELSDRNHQAYIHYKECRATGIWPDDLMVRRNARIIRDIEAAYDRLPMLQMIALLGGKIT